MRCCVLVTWMYSMVSSFVASRAGGEVVNWMGATASRSFRPEMRFCRRMRLLRQTRRFLRLPLRLLASSSARRPRQGPGSSSSC